MLKIHHLGVSQSERILWLCEELGCQYELIKHTRDPLLSPASLKNVAGNETGTSPFMEDPEKGVRMSESSAIVEYIIHKYGGGRLAVRPDDANYADYLYWFHYSNCSLQPAMISVQFLEGAKLPKNNQTLKFARHRLAGALRHVDSRLANNKFLAGDELTAADIMTVYSVTTQRYWGAQADLSTYKNILRWLQECSSRSAYQRAMEKGDPEMRLLLGPEPPKTAMFEAGGVASGHWRKHSSSNI